MVRLPGDEPPPAVPLRPKARDYRGPKLTGIIGWPLESTLSPAIHNEAFRRTGLDWVYAAWPVPPGLLEAAMTAVRTLGVAGVNVTMPHKENVLGHLDGLSAEARAVGAVNTIEVVGEQMMGHNTDAEGFRDFIANETGHSVESATAVVLGAGGAARSVVWALDALLVGRITVVARRIQASEEVAALAARAEAAVDTWANGVRLAERADVIVNATPVGSGGEDCLPGAAFRPGQLVVDLIYAPPTTPLVERARAAGADAWGGVGMLVRQAAGSFRIWTGTEPPVAVMSAAAVHAIGFHG